MKTGLLLSAVTTWVIASGDVIAQPLPPPVTAEKRDDFALTLREFSASRHKLETKLSQQLSLHIPEGVEAFFGAAEAGHWHSISNKFALLLTPGPYCWAKPELRNALWAPIHETYGIYELNITRTRTFSLWKRATRWTGCIRTSNPMA